MQWDEALKLCFLLDTHDIDSFHGALVTHGVFEVIIEGPEKDRIYIKADEDKLEYAIENGLVLALTEDRTTGHFHILHTLSLEPEQQ